MALDAHRQSRGASEQSLEQVFKRLERLERACRARDDIVDGLDCRVQENIEQLRRDAEWQRRHEQDARDALRLLIMTRTGAQQETPPAEAPPELLSAVAVGAVSRPGRPKLRLIVGGLAAAMAAAFVPAAAYAAAHHHDARHVAAVRCHDQRGRRCSAADGGTMKS